ncbi:MAG TPA: dihydrofolate reductase family protein [Candidatus Saccharimonadales bacterium]|nr:dihydrofolate reductase family protein [Candidatus Saccharimonadales bacterium]
MNVFIVVAVSADGFIALNDKHISLDWTSKEDKRKFVELTKRAGVMIMGRKTFDTIGKALPGRKTYVYTSGEIHAEGVESTDSEPKELIQKLSEEGYSEIAVIGGQTIFDLFLKDDAIDEIYLTIEPVLFGQGLTIGKSLADKRLKLLEHEKLNDDTLLLHYKVIK